MNDLEEGSALRLDFGKLSQAAACGGLIPVAVQDADSGQVLLVAYTNEAAFRAALAARRLILWSTSRNELWEKGRTSGDTFDLVEVRVNCEQNSLLYRVRARRGGICHTRGADGRPRTTCFYRRLNLDTGTLDMVEP